MTERTIPQTKMTAIQRRKMTALKPIIERWNKTHLQDWEIKPILGFHFDSDSIEILSPEDDNHAHGCLVEAIAGICGAYDWTWAIYIEDGKLQFNI